MCRSCLFCCKRKPTFQLMDDIAGATEMLPLYRVDDIEKESAPFTYAYMQARFRLTRNYYGEEDDLYCQLASSEQNDLYLHLSKKGQNRGDVIGVSTGWKVHVSVAYKDIGKAWDITLKKIIEYGVCNAKVITTGSVYLEHVAKMQKGKEIVIYAFDYFSEDSTRWSNILNELEQALREGKVAKGEHPIVRVGNTITGYLEPKISESLYFYCEDDSRDIAKFLSNRDDRGIFSGIIISPAPPMPYP